MNIKTILSTAISSIFSTKSPSQNNDFFQPDDYNGTSPFFMNNDTKSPSDFYTGWGHTGISTISNHVAILERTLEDDKQKVVKNSEEFNMITFELLRDLVSFLEIHGRSYILKVRAPGGKKILGLEVLNPQAVSAIRWAPSSGRYGIQKYEYRHNQKKWEYMADDIIAFTYFHPNQYFPYNNEKGFSGLAASDRAIEADKNSDVWNSKIFENGGYAGNILATEQALNAETSKRILDSWDRDHKGVKNGHASAILTHGLKPVAGVSQKDMDFSKMKEVSRDIIMGRMKVPKAIIGLAEGVNVGNVVAFDRIFSRRTVLPIAILIQEGFNRGLFIGKGKFRFLNVIPTDVDEILRLYAIGMLTKNQALTEIGYDPIGPDGDVYIAEAFSISSPSAGNQGSGDNSVPTKQIDVSYEKCLSLTKGIFENLKKKELQTDELMEKDWGEYVKRNDKYEKQFAEKIKTVWKKQEAVIISQVKKGKAFLTKAPALEEDWYNVYYLALSNTLTDIVKKEGARANAQIGLSATFGVPQARVRDLIIQQIEELQLSVDSTTNAKIATAIADADTTFDAVKAVEGVFADLSESRVKTISRSETVRAATTGTTEQWKESGQVVSKIWYTVEDERTCEFCGAMHGKKIGLDEVFFNKGDTLKVNDGAFVGELQLDYTDTSGPPLHPKCRCRLKAVLKK